MPVPKPLAPLQIELGPLSQTWSWPSQRAKSLVSLTTHSLPKTGGLLVPQLTGKGSWDGLEPRKLAHPVAGTQLTLSMAS